MQTRLLEEGGTGLFELLEILAEAVTIRMPDGAIAFANRAAREQMGFDSLEELRGRPARTIMDEYLVTDEHGELVQMDDLPSVRLLRGAPAKPLLMQTVHRDTGAVRWLLLRATGVPGSGEGIAAAVTVIEDLTAVKSAELRTRLLAESGRLLASSLDYQQTLRNVANLAVPALADWCAVDLIDDQFRRERVVTAHRDPEKRALADRLRALEPDELSADQGLGRVIRTGVAELYPEVSDEQLAEGARSDEHLSLLRELQMRSVAIVPLPVPGHVVGVMTLVTAESRRRLTAEDLALAEQLGRRAAVAVENARLHTTLVSVARTLQRSLLPDKTPEVPGWEIAALYRPVDSGERIDVGGDFYELFETGAGWFAVIGDVTGKGVNAAALTALLRYGARFAGRYEAQAGAILARLDESLKQRSEASMCSVLCAQLNHGQLVLASAGHPPALIVNHRGEIKEAPETGPLLGAFPDGAWPEETVRLAENELILLYTDGVTEMPNGRERFGDDRLRALISERADYTPEELLTHLEAALTAFSNGTQRDDIAALALRPRQRT